MSDQSTSRPCIRCGGSGRIKVNRGFYFRFQPCPDCGGNGFQKRGGAGEKRRNNKGEQL